MTCGVVSLERLTGAVRCMESSLLLCAGAIRHLQNGASVGVSVERSREPLVQSSQD
jgi:hypothetical protein